ncbi:MULTISPECIES: hypothetical protein [unclassified Brenneria]|uniref:hypothetical protein n=1 Tax=unclassified Brenneria TaxID=2634434 RepID=UPI0018F0D0A9|nr:hypothetical protein [Brenneria sp. L3-3C-1]MBJ7222123.1 hypothetical protein [Brenneria sp. L3-3C-1]MEE3643367.1 hypothetical protein [Brenneria sp. L3_3C_1]
MKYSFTLTTLLSALFLLPLAGQAANPQTPSAQQQYENGISSQKQLQQRMQQNQQGQKQQLNQQLQQRNTQLQQQRQQQLELERQRSTQQKMLPTQPRQTP